MNIGHDGGFYETKTVGGDEERESRILSFAAPPAESLFSLNGHQTVIVESDEGQFLVGEEAIKKARTGVRKESRGWIESAEWMSLFYAAMSNLTSATQVNVNLVTGLPLADYAQDRETLRARLQGAHRFTRVGRDSQWVKVVRVRVVPQGWGPVLALLLDDAGKVVRPELARQRVAVVDIGGHNVGYLAVDGLSDLPAETRGTERGAWHVVRALRDYLEVEHRGLSRLPDHRLMEAVVAGEIWDADRKVDLGPVVGGILEEVGQEIVDTARQYWGHDAATFRSVVVCGGGAYLWGKRVKQAFRQAVILERPEMANAVGFYRFAVNQARSNKS